jgi:hypothetical protein
MDERARRVAENEVLFRQVNELVVSGGRRAAETFEVICECEDTGCMEHIRVTTEGYERARNEATDFLLKAGHEKPEFETLVKHDPLSPNQNLQGVAGRQGRDCSCPLQVRCYPCRRRDDPRAEDGTRRRGRLADEEDQAGARPRHSS